MRGVRQTEDSFPSTAANFLIVTSADLTAVPCMAESDRFFKCVVWRGWGGGCTLQISAANVESNWPRGSPEDEAVRDCLYQILLCLAG